MTPLAGALLLLAAFLILVLAVFWLSRSKPKPRAVLFVVGNRSKGVSDMPGTVLVEIPFDKEAGFKLGAQNADGSAGEFEAGSVAFSLDSPDFYQSPGDDVADVWIGSNLAGATATLTGSGDADLGAGVTTISDSVSLRSVSAQAVAAVLSSVTFRPKPTP